MVGWGWIFGAGLVVWVGVMFVTLGLCEAAREADREAWREERLRALADMERARGLLAADALAEVDELERLWLAPALREADRG